MGTAAQKTGVDEMTDLITAAQQALEALGKWSSGRDMDAVELNDLIATLEAALEQPEQEPVAWMDPNRGEVCRAHWLESHAPERDVDRFSYPLYTHPPRREWQGLTDEEVDQMAGNTVDAWECARAIEAALKERNA